MKIYILPIEKKFQQKSKITRYPKHNHDFGVEQDFLKFILKNKHLITSSPKEADWHYLPIFWTRWLVNHKYGEIGMDELQNEVNKKILNSNKTFMICQYADGPLVDVGDAKQFLSSRKTEKCFDMPLLSKNHRKPLFFKPQKKYLASFIGRFDTHEIRKKLDNLLNKRQDIYIYNGNKGEKFFVKKILESYISLCPRGFGGGSFRFYESMQLGVVPFLIGDIDTRPFKKFIDWNKISLYATSADETVKALNNYNKPDLLKMGEDSKKFYKNNLSYQNWCQYIIKTLETKNKTNEYI